MKELYFTPFVQIINGSELFTLTSSAESEGMVLSWNNYDNDLNFNDIE